MKSIKRYSEIYFRILVRGPRKVRRLRHLNILEKIAFSNWSKLADHRAFTSSSGLNFNKYIGNIFQSRPICCFQLINIQTFVNMKFLRSALSSAVDLTVTFHLNHWNFSPTLLRIMFELNSKHQ